MNDFWRNRLWIRVVSFTLSSLVALLLGACGQLEFALGPLISNVEFTDAVISPNADGVTDVTEIRYSLRRSADVNIYFDSQAGERFFFRDNRRRSAGDYSVQWGGVIDSAFDASDMSGKNQVISRVLPDGVYRWTIEATEDNGSTASASGEITLQGGDSETPQLQNFTVVPEIFRPNQDGLADDWVSISYFLSKDVNTIGIYLVDPAEPDVRYFVADQPGVVKSNERGYHQHRYEGGVDLNAEPPADGDYLVVGEARDLAGNAVRVQRKLTIAEGGKPRADIAQGDVDWQGEMNRVVVLNLGQKLCFRAVVTNVGAVPIRTAGPWPGQEYRFGENFNTLAVNEQQDSWGLQAGVWRLGINYESAGSDFPYRWAIGRPEDLERRTIDGQDQWYLLPGASGQVSGCILIDEKPPLGTNFWWAGLIHQAVSVANNYVDRISVQVGVP